MKKYIFIILVLVYNIGFSQLNGSFNMQTQYYIKDSVIQTKDVKEKLLNNAFFNLNYSYNNIFDAGIRIESYLNTLLGYPSGYEGTYIPYRYLKYKNSDLNVVVGNFYEQFGSGMILKSWENKELGYDNAFEGVKIDYNLYNGIILKGLVAKQRKYQLSGNGIIRGIDGEIDFNQLFDTLSNKKLKLKIGANFVSKYEKDEDNVYNLPENVGAMSGRININYKDFSFFSEYLYKINDPNADNFYNYKDGKGFLLSTNYSKKGLGFLFEYKVIDNFSFRSERNAQIQELQINYLSSTTKQHTYNLPATLYPYAVQPNGEVAIQTELAYKFAKNSILGGKNGTFISINFSNVNSLDSTKLSVPDSARKSYSTNYFSLGKSLYYRDLSILIKKKINANSTLNINYINIFYNKDIIEGKTNIGLVNSNIIILELVKKIKNLKSLRFELQHLNTSKKYYIDNGNWLTFLIELGMAPKWKFTIMDQYNYGNPIETNKIHYPYLNLSYTSNRNTLLLGYGRQKQGIFCIGGVCRNVPASNGFSLSIYSNF